MTATAAIAARGSDYAPLIKTVRRAGLLERRFVSYTIRGLLTIGFYAATCVAVVWVDTHNRHHANPNHEDRDPDIGDGVLAFATAQVAKRTGPVSRFIARRQAFAAIHQAMWGVYMGCTFAPNYLFPNMPCASLRHAQPLVRAHCEALGLPYEPACT